MSRSLCIIISIVKILLQTEIFFGSIYLQHLENGVVGCKMVAKRQIFFRPPPNPNPMVNNRVSKRVADPEPVFLHGSGSGFQISLDPVSAQILEQNKIAERSIKVIYQNL